MRTKIGMHIYLYDPSAWARVRRQKCPFRPCGGRRLSPWSPLSASVRSLPTRKHLAATNAHWRYPAGSMMVRSVFMVAFEPRKALLSCQRAPGTRPGTPVQAQARQRRSCLASGGSTCDGHGADRSCFASSGGGSCGAGSALMCSGGCGSAAAVSTAAPGEVVHSQASAIAAWLLLPGSTDVRSDVLQPIRSSTDGS